jgi:hypothetical protein
MFPAPFCVLFQPCLSRPASPPFSAFSPLTALRLSSLSSAPPSVLAVMSCHRSAGPSCCSDTTDHRDDASAMDLPFTRLLPLLSSSALPAAIQG